MSISKPKRRKEDSMKRIVLIAACNSAASVPDFTAVAASVAANSRVVEGKMTIPYGLWPVTIRNADGKEEQVVQRLDKAVAGRLVAAFNSVRGRLSRLVSGSPIYLGHPDYAENPSTKAWRRLGKCLAMEAGDEALTVTGEFTADGKAIVAANEALAPSPHWGLARTGEKKDNLDVCDPVAFYSMGLTVRPNISGAAINEDAMPAMDAAAMAAMMDVSVASQELAKCCAEIVQLRDELAAAVTARDSANQQLTALAKMVADKEAQCQSEKAWNANLRAEVDALRAALQQEKANAIAAGVNSILDGAVAVGRIVAADRDHWRDKITKTPAAANELFTPDLKTSSTVPTDRAAAANDALGSRPASDRFVELVHQHMAATKLPWEQAWNECKSKHNELFKLMPNGGRA
jgi:hypothetical protein